MKYRNYLEAISNDLGILPYKGEQDELYEARLLYSALSVWIRMMLFDDNPQDDYSKGVSLVHIHKRINDLSNIFFNESEYLQEWFSFNGGNTTSKLLISRLFNSGVINKVIGSERVCSVSTNYEKISGSIFIVKGAINSLNRLHANGVSLCLLKTSSNIEFTSMPIGSVVRSRNAKEYTINLLKQAKWVPHRMDSKYEFFNPLFKGNSLYRSWNAELNTSAEYTVSRLVSDSQTQFFLVKVENDKIYSSVLTRYPNESKELRRVLYGIRAIYNNCMYASIQQHLCGRYFSVKLSAKLPVKDEMDLMALGWPIKKIDDVQNILFRTELKEYVCNILENLNIKLKEK